MSDIFTDWPTSIRNFNSQLKEVKKTLLPKQFSQFLMTLGQYAIGSLIDMAPVKTGRFRGNWQLDIGRIPTGELGIRSGEAALAEGMMRLQELKGAGMGAVIWLANNVKYAVDLEDGSSTQAPHGTVAITFSKMASIFG